MKKRYLVTGASGFIGSNLVIELIKKGENVHIITRDKERLRFRLGDIFNSLHIYECDLLSPLLGKVVSAIKPDIIFHLAAYGVSPWEEDINEMINVTLRGTINLIHAVKETGFKLFINTSSCVEYGMKEKSMQENEVIVPISDYGVIKSATTLYCQKEAIKNNLPIISFRLFSTYGYFDQKHRVIPSIIMSAIKNDPIRVSLPTNVRDFIFVEDVVDAYLHTTKIQLPKEKIFNIGTGKEYSVAEIVKICLKLSSSRSTVLWGSVPVQSRLIEPAHWKANLSNTRKNLQWEPKYTLEQGLQKTIDWFRQYGSMYA